MNKKHASLCLRGQQRRRKAVKKAEELVVASCFFVRRLVIPERRAEKRRPSLLWQDWRRTENHNTRAAVQTTPLPPPARHFDRRSSQSRSWCWDRVRSDWLTRSLYCVAPRPARLTFLPDVECLCISVPAHPVTLFSQSERRTGDLNTVWVYVRRYLKTAHNHSTVFVCDIMNILKYSIQLITAAAWCIFLVYFSKRN